MNGNLLVVLWVANHLLRAAPATDLNFCARPVVSMLVFFYLVSFLMTTYMSSLSPLHSWKITIPFSYIENMLLIIDVYNTNIYATMANVSITCLG